LIHTAFTNNVQSRRVTLGVAFHDLIDRLSFSGSQMFALGMIGEYLAQMHFRMMERPTYIVWENTRYQSDHEKQIPAH
jgi:hypothetical protein